MKSWMYSTRGEGAGHSLKWPIREAPPEWGIFFRRWLYEGVGISLAEVNERIEKCVILIGENYGFEKFKNT